MRRLFTFGCSFTDYLWPTWADIVGCSFDEYYNAGRSGAGNNFIFQRLIEMNVTHSFTPADTVIIMWTTYQRHDFYKDNQWKTGGNIFHKQICDQEYINKYFDMKGVILHSLNVITASIDLLKAWGVKWRISSINNLHEVLDEPILKRKYIDRLLNKRLTTEYPEFKKYETIFHGDYWISPLSPSTSYTLVEYKPKGDLFKDNHPTPREHLKWVESHGFIIDPRAIDLVDQWHDSFPGMVDSVLSWGWMDDHGIRKDIQCV